MEYLVNQNIVLDEGGDRGKLKLEKFEEMTGTCSIKVIRGEPKIGFNITFTAIWRGVKGTNLEGLKVDIVMVDLMDDDLEIEAYLLDPSESRDPEQCKIAQELMGYDEEMVKIAKIFSDIMKEYPQRV